MSGERATYMNGADDRLLRMQKLVEELLEIIRDTRSLTGPTGWRVLMEHDQALYLEFLTRARPELIVAALEECTDEVWDKWLRAVVG